MPENRENLSGIFAPVVTPFHADNLKLDSLRNNLQQLGHSGLQGYLALGSNGEFMSLTDSEQTQILEVFAAEKGDKIIMVGTACESTVQTITKSKLAADMGFGYVSVLTPHYFAKQMKAGALQDYYVRIADSVPVPVLLYNAPGFTGGVQIPSDTLQELAQHPNIVGIKDSSPTGPAKYLSVLDPSEDFHVLAGSANFCYPSLHLGASGGIISLANAFPEPCCELYRLFIEGRYDDARDLHFRLSRLNSAVSGSYGVSGVKSAMQVAGYDGGEPRHPLKAVTPEERDKIAAAIRDAGFNV